MAQSTGLERVTIGLCVSYQLDPLRKCFVVLYLTFFLEKNVGYWEDLGKSCQGKITQNSRRWTVQSQERTHPSSLLHSHLPPRISPLTRLRNQPEVTSAVGTVILRFVGNRNGKNLRGSTAGWRHGAPNGSETPPRPCHSATSGLPGTFCFTRGLSCLQTRGGYILHHLRHPGIGNCTF